MKMKKGPANGKLFTDEDWNDEATLTEGSYPYSKVRLPRSLNLLALVLLETQSYCNVFPLHRVGCAEHSGSRPACGCGTDTVAEL